MPFWTGDTDKPDTVASTSTLRVAPDQVLKLKAEVQAIYDDVDIFVRNYGQSMAMRPLGADPVSAETADTFNENAKAALEAAHGYISALRGVLDALDQAAKTYDLVEDTNTQTFRHGVQ